MDRKEEFISKIVQQMNNLEFIEGLIEEIEKPSPLLGKRNKKKERGKG
jgi:hypothetical protein